MAANLEQPAGQAPAGNMLSQFVDSIRQRQATNGYPVEAADEEPAQGELPEQPEGTPADMGEDAAEGMPEEQPSLPEGDEQFVEQTDDGEAAAFQQQLDTYVQSQVQAQVSQMLPQLLAQYDAVKRAEANFFKQNPDLEAHTDLIQLLAQGVEQENPDISNEDLLRTVADQARQKLNLVQAGPSLPTGSPMGGQTGQRGSMSPEDHQAQMMADFVKFKRGR
jgi:hypothetical protein